MTQGLVHNEQWVFAASLTRTEYNGGGAGKGRNRLFWVWKRGGRIGFSTYGL